MQGGGIHDRRTVVVASMAVALGAAAAGCRPAGRAVSTSMPGGPPRSVISLNPCLDVILVEVADPGQIAALSHYARDHYGSTIADLARTLPFTWGSAEEVIALQPDMVLAPRLGARASRAAIERAGIRTALFDVPETVADSLQQVRELARLVGHPARGLALSGRIEAALKAAGPRPGTSSLSALVFMPGGFVSGPGSLMDEMMRRVGLMNAASRYGLTGSLNLPLERVLADPPDILLAGEPLPGAASRAERILDHPALTRLADEMHRAVFPERLLFCGGPVLIKTAAALARARDAALLTQA